MTEFRQDIFSGKSVIINEARGKRPKDLNSEYGVSDKDCLFCLGNEDKTPPAALQLGSNPWQGRVVPNKFPIVNKDEGSIRGHHEVVIESNKHNHNFYNMNTEDYKRIIYMYSQRYQAHLKRKDAKYISIFKNYKKEAGASLEHPHSQIIALPIIPKDVEEELQRCQSVYDKENISLHQQVLEQEVKENKRVIHDASNFLVIAPYASLFNYEVQIIYKHNKGFHELNDIESTELVEIFKNLFHRLYINLGDVPFNMFFHFHPTSESLPYYHWHIHVTPRLSMQAGFEIGTGIYVNSVSPEKTAKMLKWL